MATSPSLSPSTTIDLGSLDAANELQFQDFHVSSATKVMPLSDMRDNPFEDVSIRPDEERLLSSPSSPLGSSGGATSSTSTGGTGGNTFPFWQKGFLARYFDVTTNDVMYRILGSMMPFIPSPGSPSFLERSIKQNPDLYGPLWINVTLIFCIAICGNISTFLSTGDPEHWRYDFTKVGLAASTVSTYTLAVPLCLTFFFWFRGCTITYSMIETICAYGYSLSVYIPLSVLVLVAVKPLQYVMVSVAALTSGLVLVTSFAPVVKSDPGKTIKYSYIMLLLILAMHALVAFTFLVYFF